ncbi:MAG: glycosyltransferase family 4 protein [Candidatus Omnitrophica bacterium]|nr:glycosyltransferase family 4 protein [Candidatus Omnitrophota bacterium]
MSCGGAERVISKMANYYASKGSQVTLMRWTNSAHNSFYKIHPSVEMLSLDIGASSKNIFEGLRNNWKRIKTLNTAMRHVGPDVVISFQTVQNVISLLATRGLNIPIIVSERFDPSTEDLKYVWKILRQILYPSAFRVVVQTEAASCYFSNKVRRLVKVIPNPVEIETNVDEKSSADPKTHKNILAMGRLVSQKGFDMLIRAFSTIANKNPNWSLTIWGEGPLRLDLESLIYNLGLHERVHLPGLTDNVFREMHQADLFVLSSRYEGFPNVLLEAMACGLPVISFDCQSGPKELIQNKVNGILVTAGDVNALASEMDRLMTEESERRRLAMRAAEIKEQYSMKNIMKLWDDFLDEIINPE